MEAVRKFNSTLNQKARRNLKKEGVITNMLQTKENWTKIIWKILDEKDKDDIDIRSRKKIRKCHGDVKRK